MATNFPTSVDALTNPVSNDSLNSPSHSAQHANANDAIEAIEGYLLNGGQGLTLIKKQVIGTAVSSVAITNAFSSTYANYKIIVNGGTISAGNPVFIQLGPSSVSAYNTSYYLNFIYANYSTASVASSSDSNTNSWQDAMYPGGNGYVAEFDLFNPQASYRTGIKGTRFDLASGGIAGPITGFHDSTNSFTDFSLLPQSASTLTGGTIYVYGYGIGT